LLTIYTKTQCSFCDIAKTYLKAYEIPFTEVNIEEDAEAREFVLSKGHKTVPQIYRDGELFVEGGAQGLIDTGHETIRERLGDLGLDGLTI